MRLPFFITREGFAYLFVLAFVLAVAILRDINLLYVVAGLMVGPLLFNGMMAALIPRGVRVRRQLPAALMAGEMLEANLSLTNPRRWLAAWLIVVTDTLERHRAPLRQRRVTATAWFPHVPAGATRHTSYRGRLTERGRYQFGPLRLSCRFPLGLVRRTVTVPAAGEVVIYPRLGELTARAKALWRQTASGQRSSRRRGRAEAEFHGLRDWQRGDSRRWIHWRSSARRGEIVVREFEHQQHHDLAIVLDLMVAGPPTRAQIEITERAVSIAATFIDRACAEPGSRVMLAIAAKSEMLFHGLSSPAVRAQMLAALAEVEAAAINGPADARKHEARLIAALDAVGRMSRSDAPAIVVSTRDAHRAVQTSASDRAMDAAAPANWTTIDAGENGAEYVVFEERD
ncbi:MAG: DUF58 domain-containing protein [Pirellulales bacterium]